MFLSQTPHSRAVRRRVFGLVLAFVLTLVAFGLTRAPLPRDLVIGLMAALAALQMGVHLVLFLDVGKTGSARTVNLAVGFALLLILVMVGGTFWVMHDLHLRMMG